MRPDSFSNQPIKIQQVQQNLQFREVAGLTGTVTAINRKSHTCEVFLINGDKKSNVRMPVAAVNQSGTGHGRYQSVSVNQLVFVAFVMGVQTTPMILETYPFYAREEDFDNLRLFMDKYPEIQENEIVDFHQSGYCVRYSDGNIIFQAEDKTEVMRIDMVSQSLTVGNGIYPAIKTDSLTSWMDDIYNCLSSLKNAIDSAVIVPLDGGASLKAAMSSALSSFPPVQTPSDISDTNAFFGDP